MSERDTLSVLAAELAHTLDPLAKAIESPATFASFMRELGWNVNTVIQPILDLGSLLAAVSAMLEDGEITVAEVPTLIGRVGTVLNSVQQLRGIASGALPPTVDATAFRNEFPEQLVQYLIVTYLLEKQSKIGNTLRTLGIIRIRRVAAAGQRPAFDRREIAWADLGRFLDDPLLVLKNSYGWNTSGFDAPRLLDNVFELGRALGINAATERLAPELLSFLTQGALSVADVNRWIVRWDLIHNDLETPEIRAGIGVQAVPETASTKPGFALLPYAQGRADYTFDLNENLALKLAAAFDLGGGVAIIVRPGRDVELVQNIIDAVTNGTAPPAGAEVSLLLDQHGANGAPIRLVGAASGSRFEYRSASVRSGARIQSDGKKSAFIEIALKDAALVIELGGDADGFLAQLLPGGFRIDTGLTVGFDSTHGLYFVGSAGLEILLPAHIALGPLEIQSALIAVKAVPGQIPIDLAGTIKGNLGPLQAVVENVGFRASLTFPGSGGNLGPADLSLGFKPPNGVGLSVDAGVVKGGGYLFIDTERGEYAGALELTFSGFLSLKAIGIITTRMPDGSSGFSLLIIITAEFGTGIQLGFGFTLLAVGGLLGLNRTMRLDALAQGVRTGAINSVMFPQDVVANAPRIISDLRTFFPPEQGKFLIGPMAKLGWGTPTLISLALGIIIEIPGNIAIVGVLTVALPAKEAPLIIIQVAFIGAIEFDKQRVWFFAAMFDSRVLFCTIEGEMGVLAAFGNDANFVVSVGGFHPRFNPPPLPFPSPRRVAIDLANTPVYRIRVEGYFAVTSNTAQLGARAELHFGFDAFGIQGHIGFDALFQFSPFYFIIEIGASVSLKAFGVGVFSINLQFTLEGPAPYRAHGRGSISLLFFDISADFDITWGESRNTTLEPIKVMPLLHTELNKLDNWRALVPPSNNLLVSLRNIDAAADLVLHPVGTLRISQKAVPLDLTIDKLGSRKVEDAKRFHVEVATGGLVKKDDTDELFAIAQFQNMDDAAKLSRPAFEPQNGGVELSVDGADYRSSRMVKRVVRYEETIIDTNYKKHVRRFALYSAGLFGHFMRGNAVAKSALSQQTKQRFDPHVEKVAVQPVSYTVAFTDTNRAYSGAASFRSEASARDFLRQRMSDDPQLADALHVIPFDEVAV